MDASLHFLLSNRRDPEETHPHTLKLYVINQQNIRGNLKGLPQPCLFHVTTGLSLFLFMLQFFILKHRANCTSPLHSDGVRIKNLRASQAVYNHPAVTSICNACVEIPKLSLMQLFWRLFRNCAAKDFQEAL